MIFFAFFTSQLSFFFFFGASNFFSWPVPVFLKFFWWIKYQRIFMICSGLKEIGRVCSSVQMILKGFGVLFERKMIEIKVNKLIKNNHWPLILGQKIIRLDKIHGNERMLCLEVIWHYTSIRDYISNFPFMQLFKYRKTFCLKIWVWF